MIFLAKLLGSQAVGYENVSVAEFKDLMQKEYILLDVRSEQEYNQGHIDGTLLIDIRQPDFKQRIKKLDKNKSYLVYCRSGNRSGKACSVMHELGFTSLYNLQGGYMAWSRSN